MVEKNQTDHKVSVYCYHVVSRWAVLGEIHPGLWYRWGPHRVNDDERGPPSSAPRALVLAWGYDCGWPRPNDFWEFQRESWRKMCKHPGKIEKQNSINKRRSILFYLFGFTEVLKAAKSCGSRHVLFFWPLKFVALSWRCSLQLIVGNNLVKYVLFWATIMASSYFFLNAAEKSILYCWGTST